MKTDQDIQKLLDNAIFKVRRIERMARATPYVLLGIAVLAFVTIILKNSPNTIALILK